jgi:hypothetical protein
MNILNETKLFINNLICSSNIDIEIRVPLKDFKTLFIKPEYSGFTYNAIRDGIKIQDITNEYVHSTCTPCISDFIEDEHLENFEYCTVLGLYELPGEYTLEGAYGEYSIGIDEQRYLISISAEECSTIEELNDFHRFLEVLKNKNYVKEYIKPRLIRR